MGGGEFILDTSKDFKIYAYRYILDLITLQELFISTKCIQLTGKGNMSVLLIYSTSIKEARCLISMDQIRQTPWLYPSPTHKLKAPPQISSKDTEASIVLFGCLIEQRFHTEFRGHCSTQCKGVIQFLCKLRNTPQKNSFCLKQWRRKPRGELKRGW